MPSQQQIRENITSTIIEALKSGNLPPWRQPWTNDPNCGAPCNIVSRRRYRGINPLLLRVACMRHQFQSRWWATYQQWKEMGGFVRRRPENVPQGAWGATIIYFSPVTKTIIDRHGNEVEETFPILRTYHVFNLCQVDGPFDHLRPGNAVLSSGELDERCERADEVIAATDADIRYGGNQPYYDPRGDYIQTPFRHQFSGFDFYETVFHEVSHWAEHPSRLGRDANEGDKYAFGELVAEISGCYLTSEMGLPTSQNLDNHLAYLEHWLRAMESDPRFIFQAASRANRVADFVLSFSRSEETEPAIAE